ncbi:cytochrome c biogenesis protein CcdA [Nesterenkonia sp. MY13]|uniref:Cytochrome c biogenesis protein CcdA n=1 Tax=Nesterenkonia sedimenti TaxID=1463632 RepID=A0A7X8YCE3_9MICC|nr:cytochrome c biogenesis CcdA family protein [Nesterenkonia sedimenti]NLS08469.1 cytochrome c biogenesis protein CcdA [Nesterenkonia sedimenti]
MEITLLTAFFGGVLALLSPCGALLLPAFFASSLGNRLRILLHGGIFYLGLALTLVPLGLGLGALGTLVTSYREVMIIATSAILVLLGLAQALGFGFDMSKYLPGAGGLQQKAHTRSGALRTFLLGAASGVAGFCAGPILGAILTLAMAQGDTLRAGFMLAVYGAGMVVPLIGLAAIWTRLGPRAMKVLRGRGFTVLGRQLHTTSVVTGLLIAGVGVLFWTTNGLVTAPSLLPAEIDRWLQSNSGLLASPVFNAVVVAVIAISIILIWALQQRRRHREEIS